MSLSPEELYRQREERFNNIVAPRKPDRVAVAPMVTDYFANRIRGVSNRDAIYDDVLRFRLIKEATLEFEWDLSPSSGLYPAAAWEAIGTTQMSWPGRGVSDDASHLGDKMCFWGNVPASLMITGTPAQVKDDVKRLIDLFGDTGALIIDSTVGAPDGAKPENMHALREAVEEYGTV